MFPLARRGHRARIGIVLSIASAVGLLVAGLPASGSTLAQSGVARTLQQGPLGPAPVIRSAVKHDTSPALRTLKPAPQAPGGTKLSQIPLHVVPHAQQKGAKSGSARVQKGVTTDAMPSFQQNFEGVGNVNSVLPPDTQGDVGPNDYVQMINLSFAIWDKQGNLRYGPVPNTTLWQGFGGPCETFNGGDPVTMYDEQADQWFMSQLAYPGGADGYHQCIAISKTGDPTGAWYRYDFKFSDTTINDYPKFGVWPDAYYASANEFENESNFTGVTVQAYERDKMLQGQDAQVVSFHIGNSSGIYASLLPSDAEGGALGLNPPPGAPNPFLMFDDDAFGFSPTDRLLMWDFHVDWTTPANSTFGVGSDHAPNRFFDTAPFDSNLCGYASSCIPQPDTNQGLDSLSDRMMYRAAYRTFGDHQGIALTHSVDVNGQDQAGIRWYELSDGGSGWSLADQGTYAPDSDNRWMGSAAFDASGDLAVGYSVSSSSTYPSIRVAGRLASDPAGELALGETSLIAGGGSQIHPLARWGDYSAMQVDPTDGCTYWYTSEYMPVTSSADWHTRIGSFKFPSCTAGPHGDLTGTVTDASTNNPIAGATVSTSAVSTKTDQQGHYRIALQPGTYDVSFSAFGYSTKTMNGVEITDGGTTTLNAALDLAPFVHVSGTVTDGSGHGWPMYARIDVAEMPGGPIWTDPVTGHYSVDLPANHTYSAKLTADLPGYQVVTDTITVGPSDVTHDVQIPVTPDCKAPGYRQFEQVDAITLPTGEDSLGFSAVMDPAGKFAYFGTLTTPGRVVKIDLATFKRVDAITLPTDGGTPTSAVMDPAGKFAYFGTSAPGRVVKIDLATFQVVDAITLPTGEDAPFSAVIDPASKFAYFGTLTAPGRVVKIDLATFQRVDAITLPAGEDQLQSAVIDPAGKFAYFGAFTDPGRVVKIDLATFQRVGAITLPAGEPFLTSAVIDPTGKFAYFGTFTGPGFDSGRVVKIDLATFKRVDAIKLPLGEAFLSSAVIDPAGKFAYFGTVTAPGQVVKIDLATFKRVDAITLPAGEDDLFAAAIDPAGEFAYFGTSTSPGQVVKVQVASSGNSSCIPIPGGLVVGNVFDANTDEAINGATVASDDKPTDKKATTRATPDDPNVDDGFYSLFSSLTGQHSFTASKAPYQPASQTVNVVADDATRADFTLKAGRLSFDPQSVMKSQVLGATSTATVKLSNTGSAPADVKLAERGGSFQILTLQGSPLRRLKLEEGHEPTPAFLGNKQGGDEPGVNAGPPKDPTWSTIASYPSRIMDNSADIIDGKVYSVGGLNGNSVVDKGYVYDPANDAWSAIAAMPVAREKPNVAAVNGKLYVTGGWDTRGNPIAQTDVYDPASDSWTTVAPNPKPAAAAGVAVANGKIYLVGGCVDGVCTATNHVEVYDPSSDSWSSAADYPSGDAWEGCGGINGEVYCAGGVNGTTTYTSGNVYDPGSDSWSPIADMPLDLWASAYGAPNGLLVLSSGVADGHITNQGVAYDPSTDSWSALPNAQFPRYRSGASCGFYKLGGSSASFDATPDSESLSGLDQCGLSDLPWLDEAPTEFTLAPGESLDVTLTLTATSDAGVTQPGTYTASLGVVSNTPYGVNPADITMNVTPPKDWGKIAGAVTGTDCKGNTAPLPRVQVQANGTHGLAFSLKTDSAGKYGFWAPVRSSPYALIVSKDGWIAQFVTNVKMKTGKTTTVNFNLRRFHC